MPSLSQQYDSLLDESHLFPSTTLLAQFLVACCFPCSNFSIIVILRFGFYTPADGLLSNDKNRRAFITNILTYPHQRPLGLGSWLPIDFLEVYIQTFLRSFDHCLTLYNSNDLRHIKGSWFSTHFPLF